MRRALSDAPGQALSALHALDPGCGNELWAKIGMAAKAAGVTFEDFNAWSAPAHNYGGETETFTRWKSFRTDGRVQAGTLFSLAKEAGWKRSAANIATPKGVPARPEPSPRTPRHKAAEVWQQCEPASSGHGYIVRKGGRPDGLRVYPRSADRLSIRGHDVRGWLALPVRDAAGQLSTLQFISDRPGVPKLNLPGHSVAGFFGVGNPAANEKCFVVEGIGQAWSVNAATDCAALVAFGAGNQRKVIQAAKAMGAQPVLVADRGKEDACARIAVELRCTWVEMPDDMPPNGDINDIQAAEGLEAVAAVLSRELLPAANQAMPIAANDAPVLVPLDVDPAELSEDILAQCFERRHADELRYCHTAGAWYRWDETRWSKERTQYAFALARQVCRDFGKGQPKFGKAATVSAVERLAMSARRFAVTSETWDTAPWLIGTPGGTLDLRTGLVRAARPDEHITRLCGSAVADGGAAPIRWLAFLEDATRGDAALMRFLRQVAGYALTGVTTEHAMFFIYGAGGNGKSVFLNTLAGILGEYAQTAAMDTFTASHFDKHPTDVAMLKGARLVSASETEDGRAWAEARIKQMTGGDPITARFMRQDSFTYRPEFKLVIVGNHKPRLNNVDEATRRRLNIIPFVHKPTTPDPDLERALRDEWPAIFRWMVDGCLDWQEHGLVRPPVVIEATREYFEDQDVFGQWLDEHCETGASHKEANALLFKSWKRYAEAAGEHAGSTKAFCEAMRKRSLTPYKSGGSRGFTGVRLRPVAAETTGRFGRDWDE